ncbi:MAG TPA: 16S rRNA (cytosine(967)-C(5))-methyltransferase RsmB [Mogibacterium sp.]|nr:16S rRNA (cytosine(967)-C(5))-methyltransferase RsmB [Mogibacterium sp.]
MSASADWLAVFEALKRIYTEEGFSNIAINEAVYKHKGCKDSFVRAFTKGVIRDTTRLDFIIGKLAVNGLKSIKNRSLIILRMGIYAIESLDSVPNHAAVNQAVSLAKKVAKGTDKFINAILREYLRKETSIEIPDDLSVKYSFHPTIVNLIKRQYGDEAKKIIAELNKPSPLILRANMTKTTVQNLIFMLTDRRIKAEPVEDSANAVIVYGGEIIGTDIYKEGYCTVQSLSSIKAIEALSPEPGSLVLDMCSAPGGKATAIAEMMGDIGKITACDIHDHRLELIEASARRLDLKCISTEPADGTVTRDDFLEKFDYVLADVPCSGLGTCGSKPEIKLRPIQEKNPELRKIQIAILQNALKYVKEGGYVEYSTCTLNKEENESVVKECIKSCSFARIVEMQTILPYNNLVGFFYAIIQKKPH